MTKDELKMRAIREVMMTEPSTVVQKARCWDGVCDIMDSCGYEAGVGGLAVAEEEVKTRFWETTKQWLKRVSSGGA